MSGLCAFIANTKPKKIKDVLSDGLILFAHLQIKKSAWQILRPSKDSSVGERCFLEGDHAIDVEKAEEPLLENERHIRRCFLAFHTDDEGAARWKEKKLMTSKGYITAEDLPYAQVR